MSHRQWVEFDINVEGFEANLQDVRVNHGKLYKPAEKAYQKPCKASTVCPTCVEGTKIVSGKNYVFASCGLGDYEGWRSYPITNLGRGDCPCGTEGYFQIYDGKKAIAKVTWYNAARSNFTKYNIQVLDPAYTVKSCSKACARKHMLYNSEVMNNPGHKMLGHDIGRVKIVCKKN